MATREIDETEFLQSQAVVQAVTGMLRNPAAKKLLLQARKTADPTASIPELDAVAPVQDELARIREEMAAERRAREEDKAARAEQERLAQFRDQWEGQKRALRNEGWLDDGIAAVEKHARERGIPDLEAAAAHFQKLNPPPAPVVNANTSWDFFETPPAEDKFVQRMIESKGGDDHALNAEINRTLQDIRGQQGARR